MMVGGVVWLSLCDVLGVMLWVAGNSLYGLFEGGLWWEGDFSLIPGLGRCWWMGFIRRRVAP